MALFLGLAGCLHRDHPDDRMAVYNALDQHDLRSITVAQDRHAGIITLSGIVGSLDRRQRAGQVAEQSAPGYSVVNRIQVDSSGIQSEIQTANRKAQLDSAIEDRFRTTLATDPALKKDNIQYSAFHGTLTLKGAVKSYQERREAENLAKKIPQVQRVVNEIEIENDSPSPAIS